MKDVWYVIYEVMHDCDTLEPELTQFVAGFAKEKDAKAFLKLKKRENAYSISKGWRSYFIEKRPLFK